eukprot:gene9718-10709_t
MSTPIMYSPAVSEDWVAIKDFPFTIASDNLPPTSFGSDSNLSEEKLSENYQIFDQQGWDLSIRWIDDINVIEISCKRLQNDGFNSKSDDNAATYQEEYISELSVEKLLSIHEQTSSMFPSLQGLLPELPRLPKGIWSFVSSVYIPCNFEASMIEYLQKVVCILGKKIFLESFFQQETVTEEEYLENLSELNRKAYSETVKDAKDFLNEVLMLRDGSINIHDMVSLYEIEDEAQDKLDLAEAILYNFDRQPFLDMREVAHQELKRKTIALERTSLTEDENNKLFDECLNWKTQLVENEENLLDLQIQFFENSLMYLTNCRDRMIDDEMRFQKDNFATSPAQLRLRKKKADVLSLTVQFYRLQKSKLLTERAKIAKTIAGLEENENFELKIEKIEKKFFEKQIEILNFELKIIEEEEKLFRMKLNEIKKDDDEDQDDFFEAYEEQPEECEDEETTTDNKSKEIEKDENWGLRNELKKKLHRLFRKRAWLRNKKRQCEEARKTKISAKQSMEDTFNLHHKIQKKRDKVKEELESKQEFIQGMRQKTIDRLKQFKKKYPDPVIKRPPRYLPPVRRTRSGSSSSQRGECADATTKGQKDNKTKSRPGSASQRTSNEGDTGQGTDSAGNGVQALQNSQSTQLLPTPPPPPPPPPPPSLSAPPPPPFPAAPSASKTAPLSGPNAVNTKSTRKFVKQSAPNRKQATESRMLDLNTIISARQNLRKGSDADSAKARPTDASNSSKTGSLNSDMLSFIRSGVKLKKVDKTVHDKKETGLSDIAASMLRNTLAKMNKHIADSSDDENDDYDDDDYNEFK